MTTPARLLALGMSTTQSDECKERGLSELLGRVIRVDRGMATVETATGQHRLDHPGDQEFVVGDWVGLDGNRPVALERVTELARLGGPHKDTRQAVAANIDLVVIVHSSTAQFRLQLLSTFLVMAYDAGATPLVVLSKADLCEDAAARCREMSQKLGGVETMAISTRTGEAIEPLRKKIVGKTIVLLGESGTGKSTLTNTLCGTEHFVTNDVSRSGQGKHTTTHRELVVVPSGGVIIDTPGVRDAASFSGDRGIALAFHDVIAVAATCRFHDCAHGTTAGCAVSRAVADGSLDDERVEAYFAERRQRRAVSELHEQRTRAATGRPRRRRPRLMESDDFEEDEPDGNN